MGDKIVLSSYMMVESEESFLVRGRLLYKESWKEKRYETKGRKTFKGKKRDQSK